MKRQEINKTRCSFPMTARQLEAWQSIQELAVLNTQSVRNWQAPASLRGWLCWEFAASSWKQFHCRHSCFQKKHVKMHTSKACAHLSYILFWESGPYMCHHGPEYNCKTPPRNPKTEQTNQTHTSRKEPNLTEFCVVLPWSTLDNKHVTHISHRCHR